MACASPGIRNVASTSYRCSVAVYRRGEERMRRSIQSKQCDLFAAPDITPQILLLEVISGQYLGLITAVEEQDSE